MGTPLLPSRALRQSPDARAAGLHIRSVRATRRSGYTSSTPGGLRPPSDITMAALPVATHGYFVGMALSA